MRVFDFLSTRWIRRSICRSESRKNSMRSSVSPSEGSSFAIRIHGYSMRRYGYSRHKAVAEVKVQIQVVVLTNRNVAMGL